jgi:phenylalanyl-tRNA synthetase alpha chain
MYKGEKEILDILSKEKRLSFEELAERTGMPLDTIRRAAESLKENGYVTVSSEELVLFLPTPELDEYIKRGFPEFSVFEKARNGKGLADLTPEEKSIGIRWAKVKGFADIENGLLVARKSKEEVEEEKKKMLEEYEALKLNGVPKDKTITEHFCQRRLLKTKTIKRQIAEYTGKPIRVETGFDLSIEVEDAPLGKEHPLSKLKRRISEIMAELGFEEMDGSIVESAFWNFDALFQPQDHPARELADTFYLEGKAELPNDRELVERVKKAHETGWKYKWSEEEAKRLVLRTHTTALSARYLAKIKDKKPRKYFAVGRVFRNEATDYKHLAEFNQVEGIIVWENATFRDLLGILKEIYGKLGFEKVRFRPSYFPYTEPSLEVEVFFEEKKQWMELGGAGIFRPEVSIPLAGVYPVLAWGLSLERPLMLMLDMSDIREIYRNDLNFLKSARLKI